MTIMRLLISIVNEFYEEMDKSVVKRNFITGNFNHTEVRKTVMYFFDLFTVLFFFTKVTALDH